MTTESRLSAPAFALPVGLLLVAMVSVQIGAAAAKGLFPSVGAEGAAALRLMIFSPIMLAVWRPWRRKTPLAGLPSLLGYGLSLGAMNLTFYLCLRTIPLGVAVALEFTGPLVVTVLHSRRLSDLIWVALAVVGLVLLLPLGGLSHPLDPVGTALALAAGGFWGLYIVFGQKAGAEHGGAAVAMGGLVAALLVAPFGIAHAGLALLSPAIWPTALVVALMSSVIPYSCEIVGLTRLPTRTFGILMSLEPAVAALTGLIFLHERLSALQSLAILAVIAASLGAVATTAAGTPGPEPPPLI
jgi:inner membrane transporter RhtA